MHNLVLLKDIPGQALPDGCQVQACCIDSASRHLYVLTNTLDLICYHLESTKTLFSQSLLSVSGQDEEGGDFLQPDDRVISLQYVSELESVAMVCAGGSLMTVHVASRQLDVVGCMTGAIGAAAWSPDQEVLALVTESVDSANSSLIMMSKDWGVLFEVPLHPANIPSHRGVALSWRADGQYLVVSAQQRISSTSFRQLVFSRQCELQSVSEPVAEQAPLVMWRPIGSVIAAVQRVSTVKQQVIFFERNGLRHGEFSLPLAPRGPVPADARALQLDYNADSEVLAVLMGDSPSVPGSTFLLLYTQNNFHYYLKQAICLTGRDAIVSLRFDAEQASQLALLTAGGAVRWLTLAHDLCVSNSPARTAAVIDHLSLDQESCLGHNHAGSATATVYGAQDTGSLLRLTLFARAVVPPPMSAVSLPLPAPANAVAFCAAWLPDDQKQQQQQQQGASTGASDWEGAVATLLCDQRVFFFGSADRQANNYTQPPCLASVDLKEQVPELGLIRQLQWLSPTSLLLVESRLGESVDHLLEVLLEAPGVPAVPADASQPPPQLNVEDVIRMALPARILSVAVPTELRSLAVQTVDGQVLLYTPAVLSEPRLKEFASFPSPCPTFTVTSFNLPFVGPNTDASASSSSSSSDHHLSDALAGLRLSSSSSSSSSDCVALGLDTRSKLWAGDRLLAPQCSSLALHPSFVLVTTVGHPQHTLYVLDRHRPLDAFTDRDLGQLAQYDPNACRALERGSRLVAVVPGSERVVLQLPRGNLETICPRALVLRGVRRLLCQSPPDYRAALLQLRTHRIDLNLLYDHSPTQFLAHARTFVEQVANLDYINLFLSSITNDDVIEIKFPRYHPNRTEPFAPKASTYKPRPGASLDALAEEPSHAAEDAGMDEQSRQEQTALAAVQQATGAGVDRSLKVNIICGALREALESVDADKYLLCVLTSFLKQTPPDMVEALQRVRQLRERDASGQASSSSASVSSAEALKYVIFLADVNQLYLVALGLYDPDLVLMVAQHSQKDPKEYLPLMARLRSLPPPLARYEVDVLLQRWPRALQHLAQAGDDRFAEFLELMESKLLYLEALRLCPSNGDHNRYLEILRKYANHLKTNKKFSEAAQAFRSAGDLEAALPCLVQSGEWQALLITAGQLGYVASQRQQLARSAADVLAAGLSRFAEAGRLLVDVCGAVEEGVTLFCEGSSWLDALNTAYTHSRVDLVDSTVRPAIERDLDSRRDELAKMTQRLRYCAQRLTTVRQNKLALAAGGGSAGALGLADEDDDRLFDDAQSVASGMTGISGLSGLSGLSGMSGMSGASGLSRFTLASASSAISDYASNGAELRRAIKRAKKNRHVASKRLKKKIREGHPLEEDFLAKQLRVLAPSEALLSGIDLLGRALILLGRLEAAAVLQQELAAYLAEYPRLVAAVSPPVSAEVTVAAAARTARLQGGDREDLAADIAAAAAAALSSSQSTSSSSSSAANSTAPDLTGRLVSQDFLQVVARSHADRPEFARAAPVVAVDASVLDEDGSGGIF